MAMKIILTAIILLAEMNLKGLPSQQIMIRDGGFKVRTDLLAAKVGKTDDWLAALNFKTDIPKKLNPLQVFTDKNSFKNIF